MRDKYLLFNWFVATDVMINIMPTYEFLDIRFICLQFLPLPC